MTYDHFPLPRMGDGIFRYLIFLESDKHAYVNRMLRGFIVKLSRDKRRAVTMTPKNCKTIA